MATEYWTCDYGCGYHSESKRDVERHEENCDLNPDFSGFEKEIEADGDLVESDESEG